MYSVIQRAVLQTTTQRENTITVKLGNKERFYKEQIGIKKPFPVTNLSFTHKVKEHLALRNNFWATKKFLIAKFDCSSITFNSNFLRIKFLQ